MRRKLLHLLFISTISGIILCGCGNEESPPPTSTTTTTNDIVSETTTEVSTTEAPTTEAPTTDIDLEEARLWIYDSESCYSATGEVLWNENLTRFYDDKTSYSGINKAIESMIELYKAHGYSYDGNESDILSINEETFNKRNSIYFKLKLTDPVLLAELEKAMLDAYVKKGKEIPTGDQYEPFMESLHQAIDEYTTLGINIYRNSRDKVYPIWIFGEFRFNGSQFVRFTENFEWIPRWLIYNQEEKVWMLEEY